MLIQGSPNLHLGITGADWCIDGQFVTFLSYGSATPFFASIPAGPHTVALFQGGTGCQGNPLFNAATVTLAANTKTAIVAGGDAGAATTAKRPQIFAFVVPRYNVPSNGAPVISFFNASPRNGAEDFWYASHTAFGPTFVGVVSVGSSVTNIKLTAAQQNAYCFSTYNDITNALLAGVPSGSDAQNSPCLAGTVTYAPGSIHNFFAIDGLSAGSSALDVVSDQNG